MPPSAQDAATSLNNFKRTDSSTLLSQAEDKYGVKDLQSRVNNYKTLTGNLTSAIAAVDPSVTGRTAGNLTTEGQRSALVNRERAPIIGQLNETDKSLQSANGDLNVASGNAKDMASAKAKDEEDQYNQLLQTYNIANAREESQRQAAAAEAQRQEQIRQFNASQSQSAQQFAAQQASKGASATSMSPAAQKQQDMSAVASNLESKKGKDNHVSQETWNRALADWTKAGYSTAEFVKQNIRYVNQRYKGYSGFN
jgi:hypothetical protein